MFKLIVVTLAALAAILHIYGAPERRVDVARAAPATGLSSFSFAEFFGIETVDTGDLLASADYISDEEAIRMALDASKKVRIEQDADSLRGAVLAASLETTEPTDPVAMESAHFWYVTGSTVNLRQGPGTGNAIVGSVSLGTEAEVLADRDGWYQIRTPDGAASGWIFGQFLSEQSPG